MGRGTWYYSLGVFLAIVDAFVRSEFEISSWRGARVDVRTYLLGGAIDGSEANGIIRDPKLELESSRFTFDLVPLSYESVDVVVGENWLLRHKAEMVCHEKVVKMPCVMKIALKGNNKMGFIDGYFVKLVTSVVLAQQWKRCNAIILDWILNSLSPELYLGQVYYEIAFAVWEELQETHDKTDGFIIFNVIYKINVLKQGLNDVYEPSRRNILARDPLLDVKDAFDVVSREESHRGLHPGSGSGSGSKVHLAAFVAKPNNFKGDDFKRGSNNTNRGLNPNLLCKSYGLIGYTTERCNEIIGYLADFKKSPNLVKQGGKSNGRAFNGSVEAHKSASTSTNSTYFDTSILSFVLSRASLYLSAYGKEPSLSHIKCFGCLCDSTILNNHDKFSSSLNDDERDPSNGEVNGVASSNLDSPHPVNDETTMAIQIDDTNDIS
ncbi:hypothetical protein Tco_1505358 [Tanacetum coccineum]